MPVFKENCTAVILGASGGIGGAFARHLVQTGSFSRVYTLSRTKSEQYAGNHSIIRPIQLADYHEKDIEQAKSIIQAETSGIDFALVATGLLHDRTLSPEKSHKQISEISLQRLFYANSILPIVFASHFANLMIRTKPCVLAAISARVGSISDNRLGGWYGYRASKSALNMLYKNLAIEMKRLNPNLIVSLLHPGTTDTNLSRPFQSNVSPEKLFSPQDSAAYLYEVIKCLDKNDSGCFFGWDGKPIQW